MEPQIEATVKMEPKIEAADEACISMNEIPRSN